jgi:hypothetical protein
VLKNSSAIPIGTTTCCFTIFPLVFYEYFHGDDGSGIGASHQTGWTGIVAGLIVMFGKLDAEIFLQGGRAAALRETVER